MTETRRNRIQSFETFAREALSEIETLRAQGLYDPQEIAMALNRSGFPDYRAREWTGESVVAFLGDPKVEAIASRSPRR